MHVYRAGKIVRQCFAMASGVDKGSAHKKEWVTWTRNLISLLALTENTSSKNLLKSFGSLPLPKPTREPNNDLLAEKKNKAKTCKRMKISVTMNKKRKQGRS